ncbi:MAG: PP2C family protein-serine/threonine phosphatase, partial [Pseudomonadota bacterium]
EACEPGECLSRLNDVALKRLDMEKFVTLGLAMIDTDRGEIRYASAGHPPAALCIRGHAMPLEGLQSIPLGVISGHRFGSVTKKLSAETVLFMYTDGLTEARPPGGEPFGHRKAMDVIARLCELPAQQAAEALRDAALDYSQGNLKDDIAMMVIKIAGPSWEE